MKDRLGMRAAPPSSDSPESQLQFALDLAQSGRTPEAVARLRALLAAVPAMIRARCLLAMLLHDMGQSTSALLELDRAASYDPGDAVTLESRARILMALGRPVEAEAAARAALSGNPRRALAWLNLGLALDAQHRFDEAIAALEACLVAQPASAAARALLVRRLLQTHRAADALNVALHPGVFDDASRSAAIAADFLAAGARSQAVEFLRAAAQRRPHDYASAILIARVLHQDGRSSEALEWSDRAAALRPHELEPREMHAVSLIDRGDVAAGLAAFRSLLARSDIGAASANRYLILAHYDPSVSDEDLFHAHLDWARRHVEPFGGPFGAVKDLDPERTLRVGWISPRFDEGPVARFFTGTLAAMERGRSRHVLVSLLAQNDAGSATFRDLADEWLDLSGLANAALLTSLRAANFDVVIDLAGHSFGNRLGVLAQRVAPIQLCWLDYFDTTAIPAMDGWVSDAWLTPEDSTQRYTETLMRLAAGRFCYTPPAAAGEPDRIGSGATVFGSFNRLAKLNDAVLDAWADILHRTPGSLLELGAGLLDDPIARARTLERFAERGIEGARLRLHGRREYADLLEAYRGIDIALEPFPFSGCTTTCDALWMGTAVVTLPGTTFVSRQSASLLWRLGRAEWVAATTSEYVERAVAMAGRVERLRIDRRALREQTRAGLCDAAAQASEFSSLLRQLWRAHCESRGAAAVDAATRP